MSDKISDRLRYMSRLAKERAEKFSELSLEDVYIRIGGNGFRAVSVAETSPLASYGKMVEKNDKKVWMSTATVKNWSTVCKHLDYNEPAGINGTKEERRLQAYMIRRAIQTKENSLRELIGNMIGGVEFDDILFAFDEISLGDQYQKVPFRNPINGEADGIIRCDLLCVGRRGDEGWPILVELKYDRQLGRLFEQLDEFSLFVTKHYKNEFSELLMAATDVQVNCDKCYKVLVWPGNENETDSTKKRLKESDVQVIEYTVTETIPDADGDVLKSASFAVKTYE